jgi:formylglycine-generating enzyme required for sulfatase activity
MLSVSPTLLVVAVASATGIVLGQVAGAAVDKPTASAGALPAAPTVSSVGALVTLFGAASSPAAARDDEPDEPRGAHSPENPYEEPAPPRPTLVRVAVPAQGGMLRLPGGRFTMGSTNQRSPANERPARSAMVAPFWIDRTEVTVGAYRACVEKGACPRPAHASSACTFDAGDADLPVSCVHWQDADAYCRFAGKRLPTEREWEYAARGPNAVAFPWGGAPACTSAVTLVNELSAKSCAPRPARVGSHPSGGSAFGVQDLSGNVEEWTADWYVESLGPGPAPRAGAAHVLRGGGWLSTPSMSRTTTRNWGSAIEAGPNVGFRCAKDPEP